MTYPPQPPQGPPPGQPWGPPPGQQPWGPPPGQQPWGPPPAQPWGPHGGYPVGPPPKKRRTGLIAGLIVAVVLVVGGGGVAAYLLRTSDDPRGAGSGGGGEDDGARAVAQTYVREMENVLNTPPRDVDLGKLEPITCAADFTMIDDAVEQAKEFESDSASPGAGDEVQVRMEDYERTSDGATFTMTRREVGDSDTDSETDSLDMTVGKEDGDWKVCRADQDESGDSPGSGGPSDDPGGGPGREGGQPSSGELPPNPIPTS